MLSRGVFRGGRTGARPPKLNKIVATRSDQMSDFKAVPNSISAGAPPQTPLGELTEITDNGMKV